MILHDTGDRRVPITNACALYHALKDNGVTAKFIAVPVGAHFPYGAPLHESDIYRIWLDWLDQYLKNPFFFEAFWFVYAEPAFPTCDLYL